MSMQAIAPPQTEAEVHYFDIATRAKPGDVITVEDMYGRFWNFELLPDYQADAETITGVKITTDSSQAPDSLLTRDPRTITMQRCIAHRKSIVITPRGVVQEIRTIVHNDAEIKDPSRTTAAAE